MKVVETWIGSAIPFVSGSIAPSACAAIVRGFGGRSFIGAPLPCPVRLSKRHPRLRHINRHHDRIRSPCLVNPVPPRDMPDEKDRRMSDALYYYALPLAVGAVAVVLALGLVNMMR